ncbi:MAG: ethanolamine ammonia-lyase reactivating factor EutA [Promethearchaeota archaeon]
MLSKKERFDSFVIDYKSIVNAINNYLAMYANTKPNMDAEDFVRRFSENYNRLIIKHTKDDKNDLSRFFRVISLFKPALATVLSPGQDFDNLCNIALRSFNVSLDRIHKQINDTGYKAKAKGPILPGSGSMDLQYYCTVCKKLFEIPPNMKEKLLNSDETLDLPKHCDKPMIVKIVKMEPKIEAKEKFEKINIPPAELLMGYQSTDETQAEYLKLISVGIDIGTSTSHLIFSRLTLKRERSFFNMSNRFFLINREIIYEGDIIFTPLIDRNTIDIEAIIQFCEEEYKKAKITRDMIDTGVVIVTGETAKKQNAVEIADRLSSESGKFVSATAGPNFEAFLGIKGSGIVALSRDRQKTIMNVDIGGGTSNIAIASKGEVVSTSCINVGGRLLGIDENFKIWLIEEPTKRLMKALRMNYQLGDTIPEEDVKKIARAYAEALVEVMLGDAKSPIAKMLMMTDDIDLTIPVDEYSFSGGIGEFIYNNSDSKIQYGDIGWYLAEEIKALVKENGMMVIEPENKIRATVIGAGSFSLSISGSTCYVDEEIDLPINNIPVLPVLVDQDNLTPEKLVKEIKRAYTQFDMVEGEDIVGLYFKERFLPRSDLLSIFAQGIEQALQNSIANKIPIVLLFRSDLAKILGLHIHRETTIKTNLICLDELELESGDFIDIGPPLYDTKAYPVTVKSLVFNKKISEEKSHIENKSQ